MIYIQNDNQIYNTIRFRYNTWVVAVGDGEGYAAGVAGAYAASSTTSAGAASVTATTPAGAVSATTLTFKSTTSWTSGSIDDPKLFA